MKKLGMAVLGFVYRVYDLGIEIFFLFVYTPLMKKKKNTALQQAKTECKLRVGAYMLIFFIISACLFGQTDNTRFKHITIKEGLSQGAIICILQDRKGFMWFGTQDGLNRYDGYEFKIYKHDPQDPTTISDKWILSIFEDHAGVIWVGTRDGLNKFDRKSESFTTYKTSPQKPYSLSNNEIRCILEDRSGTLWIATAAVGLAQFDRKKGDFIHYNETNSSLPPLSDTQVRCIYEDRPGMLWIGTDGGLYRLDPRSDEFTFYKNDKNNAFSLSDNHITCVYEDRSGVLWVGTGGGGLNKFDRQPGIFTQYKKDTAAPFQLSNNEVRCIYEDKQGELWVGTREGLNKFGKDRTSIVNYKKTVYDTYSLSNEDVISLYQDKSGILWAGTYGGGLNLYDRDFQRFAFYTRMGGVASTLSHNTVWTFCEDNAGFLWIGTYKGLNKLDRKTGEFILYNEKSLSASDVRCLSKDSKGNIWIGTWGGGLNKFDPETGTFSVYKHIENNANSLSHDNVGSIVEDTSDFFWIGTFGGGLNKFNTSTGKCANLNNFKHDKNNANSLSNNLIAYLLKDVSGILWIGTDGGGLDKFDPTAGTFVHYRHDDSDYTSLSHDRVKSIYEDTSGSLWVGTDGGGLNKFDREKGIFKSYGEKDGLPNETIYGILEDRNGNLWLSTDMGLSRFDPEIGKASRNFAVEDGLQSNEFNTRAFFKNKKGEMFFGGIEGFNVFSPEEIKDNYFKPPLVITDFLIKNETVSIQRTNNASPLKESIVEAKKLTLSHSASFFSFDFAALHYANPRKNRYKYKMEGWDQDWIETDAKNRRATYTNLPAGEYIFKVKGSNKEGVWDEKAKEASIILKILPPPWKTWWAYTLYIIAAIVILFLIWAAWSKHFLKRKVEEQTQKLKDAQDHLIQSEKMATVGTLLSGVAHELNNPTAFIKMNSEFFDKAWKDIVPILDQYTQTHNDYKIAGLLFNESREDIGKLITGLMEGSVRIKNLIDELKIFSRKEDPLRKEVVDINRIIQSSINLTHHDIGKATNNFSYQLGEGLPVIYGNSQRLERVFINLIENACQALTNNIQGIFISTMYDITASQVLIKVKDEGRGIDEKNLKYITDPFFTTRRESGGIGLGLSISLQIIQEHGGTMKFESTPGEGTTVFVQLPVTGDEKKEELKEAI